MCSLSLCSLSRSYGKDDPETSGICTAIPDKEPADVLRYHTAFWAHIDELGDRDRILRQLAKGDSARLKNQAFAAVIADEIKKCVCVCACTYFVFVFDCVCFCSRVCAFHRRCVCSCWSLSTSRFFIFYFLVGDFSLPHSCSLESAHQTPTNTHTRPTRMRRYVDPIAQMRIQYTAMNKGKGGFTHAEDVYLLAETHKVHCAPRKIVFWTLDHSHSIFRPFSREMV